MKRHTQRDEGAEVRGLRRSGMAGYGALLTDLKERIRAAQVRAGLAVNRELIQLYWDIGRAIVEKQRKEGWGAGVIDRLAGDLQREFPEMAGFSRTNVYRMRAFYVAYTGGNAIVPEAMGQLRERVNQTQKEAQAARQLAVKSSKAIVPEGMGQLRRGTSGRTESQVARREVASPILARSVRELPTDKPPEPMASLPWSHNITLMETLVESEKRVWYARKAVKHGWSRAMLEHWIDSDLHGREGKAVTNFRTALPAAQSDLAQQILKDPYNFDFLTLREAAKEKDLEEGLLDKITRFLLELGEGFAFVGRQVRFELEGETYSVDLLFYHLRLRVFVVVDLKMGKFEPEFVGKMNFHLSLVDDRMRQTGDGPSIGLILCRQRSKLVAEYALRHLKRPVGVAGYLAELTARLPRELAGELPSVGRIEEELGRAAELGASKREKRRSQR